MAYLPIASQTLGSAATSVTFSSIPTTLNGQTLRDLVLVVKPIGTSNQFAGLELNGSSTAAYSYIFMSGQSSTTVSTSTTFNNNYFIDDGGYDVIRTDGSTQLVYHFMDFSQTNKHKLVLIRSGGGGFRTVGNAGRWANTAAISSIRFFHVSSTLAAGTNLALYGVVA